MRTRQRKVYLNPVTSMHRVGGVARWRACGIPEDVCRTHITGKYGGARVDHTKITRPKWVYTCVLADKVKYTRVNGTRVNTQ